MLRTPIVGAALPRLLLLTLLATPVAAQRPSLWTTIPLPPGATALNAIGTTATFQSPAGVHLYSGITKRWTVVAVAPGATVFQANDYVIVRDGAAIHAFASHVGTVETLTTSGSATVVSGAASSSWMTLVADGTTAYAFGAFHGKWESVALSQPNPTMVASRLLGLMLDGTTAYGVSAHHGTFVPVAADASATLSALGEAEVGTANSPDVLRAFSAQQNTWGVQNVPGATGSYQRNEFAMMWAGNQVWAFSGLCGVMASYGASAPIATIDGAEGVAGFVDGTDVVCYGPGRGQFAALPATTPSLAFDYHLALVTDGNRLTPFSAVTSTFGPALVGAFGPGSNDDVAYATDGVQVYGYSPIRNAWTLAPTANPATITAVRSAVVVGDATGYFGFSARTGTWAAQPTATMGLFTAPANGATFVARDPTATGEEVHVFDARLGRWATKAGPNPWTIRISRHTVVVDDGITAAGFGQPSSEWYDLPLVAGPYAVDVASSIATVQHGTGLLSVYCVQGSLSYTGRYPEFTQAINLGNTLRLHQVGTPGSLLFLVVGFLPGYLDLRPTVDGVAYVSPAASFALLWPQAIDGDGVLDMDIAIPNNAAFAGLQLHLQDLVLEPAGQPWLSTSVAPVIF
ncbi:MAG: hypothetical protein U1E73_07260 [Planctomycetota bacterium]